MWTRAFTGAALIAFGVLGAGRARADESEDPAREALAEAVVARAEAHAGRGFDAAFRAQIRRTLETLSSDYLESLLENGGLRLDALAPAGGTPDLDLAYTPVPPCRIIDTRAGGGSIAAGSVRDFRVTGVGLQPQGGDPAGCGVPLGPAAAALINFVAVNPVGPGNLRSWAYSTPPAGPPNASIVNFATGLNVANGIALPLCNILTTGPCPSDIRVQADGSNVHLVADVVGYFQNVRKSFLATASTTTATSAPNGSCVHHTGASVAVNAPVAGQVQVLAHSRILVPHSQGGVDRVEYYLGTSPTDCQGNALSTSFVDLPVALPTDSYLQSVSISRTLAVNAGSNVFYLNAYKSGGGSVATLQIANITATFHPN